MRMQDIWTLEKHCIGQGLFTLTKMAKTSWRLSHRKRKEQVKLLKCIQTVCDLANFVYSLLMGKGSDGEMGVLVPTLFH